MLFYFLTKIKDLDKMKTYLLDLEARKDSKQAMSLDLEYAFNLCKQSISTLKQSKSRSES